jgi:helicase SWR1
MALSLTGADTVVFYDSDFNPQMDKQCEDRAHRIGQIRDVHIYRFVSQHTVEEAMLRKANQKRSLDDLVIQKGEFDWRTIFSDSEGGDASIHSVAALTKALGEFDDVEDARAAAVAAREEYAMEGADNADFGAEASEGVGPRSRSRTAAIGGDQTTDVQQTAETRDVEVEGEEEQDDEDSGTVVDYMLTVVQREYDDFFKDWRL